MTLLLVPHAAGAQDVPALKRELETMRRQFESLTQQYERRIQELAERLQALESQRTRPAPPPVAPGAAPAAEPSAPASTPARAPTLWELATPRQPFALAQPGRPLLFDIGVSGDFVADFTSTASERRRDGTFDGRENRLFPRELSVGFFGRVDPYASATLRITGAEEPADDGSRSTEVTAALEEATVTLLTLPLGTTARFGLMRPRFGTLNVVHEDDLPQVDRPSVLARFFGEEQLNGERGLEAMWLLPTPFYQELSLGVFDGDNETAFGRGSLRDPLVLGRLRSFLELDERGGLQLDLSGATGPTSEDRRNTLAGLGLKYKLAPLVGYGFPVLTLAGEALYGNRAFLVESEDGESSTDRRESWGYYLYGQYDWTKRWAAGLRYDWTELPTASGHEWALAPYLQFKPSEFLRFRVQYKHTDGAGAAQREADEIFLQGTFILGAHPTERF
ncbi:MAG: TonB-dependent receptor [Candidatus Rokubacteria bacterium]|nr:TonB-dependent receptor [Candidatus Rokubacteria bacterium]